MYGMEGFFSTRILITVRSGSMDRTICSHRWMDWIGGGHTTRRLKQTFSPGRPTAAMCPSVICNAAGERRSGHRGERRERERERRGTNYSSHELRLRARREMRVRGGGGYPLSSDRERERERKKERLGRDQGGCEEDERAAAAAATLEYKRVVRRRARRRSRTPAQAGQHRRRVFSSQCIRVQ